MISYVVNEKVRLIARAPQMTLLTTRHHLQLDVFTKRMELISIGSSSLFSLHIPPCLRLHLRAGDPGFWTRFGKNPLLLSSSDDLRRLY